MRREHLGDAAGQAVGTPAYMSPEQADGKLDGIGPASDVYSLGATLYVLLTEPAAVRGRARRRDPGGPGRAIPPRNPVNRAVPRPWTRSAGGRWRLSLRDRYPSALALAEDIERWLADEPVSAWNEPARSVLAAGCGAISPLVAGWAAAFAVALMA